MLKHCALQNNGSSNVLFVESKICNHEVIVFRRLPSMGIVLIAVSKASPMLSVFALSDLPSFISVIRHIRRISMESFVKCN